MPATPIASKGSKDQYANVAYTLVNQTAANTLIFQSIQMAVGLFQGIAMILHRIYYMPFVAAMREIVAATDSMTLAITSSNRLAVIQDSNDPAIIDSIRWSAIAVPVANWETPVIRDFTSLPGGGKLIAANPIYAGMMSSGFGAVQGAAIKLEFTFVELNDRDYMELIQAQFPANVV